jgi:hypothetical protein
MTKAEKNFIDQVRKRIAEISVGSSAIRNQGGPGLIKISRRFFYKKIDLKEFRRELPKKTYTDYLDRLTKELVTRYPSGAKSWGAARKGLNLYFREVAYNHYLANHLKLSVDYQQNLKILKNLEVPLDKDVATGLIEKCKGLPEWISIKKLKNSSKKLKNMLTKLILSEFIWT